MSTTGQFNTKNPTIKRILKEANELASSPSPDYHAEPLESNLFEWHFTLRGPPPPSPFATGIYHGRIVLPNTYPLRPPSFRFLTPSGRFEVNREICLSISGHHEETWQPAWGIRTALVALRSFMDTAAAGQVGGMGCDEGMRRDLAASSGKWKCSSCGKTNEELLAGHAPVEGNGTDTAEDAERRRKADEVPLELRLAYREDLNSQDTVNNKTAATSETSQTTHVEQQLPTQQRIERPRAQRQWTVDVWLDKLIYGITVVLALLILRRILLYLM